MSALGEHTQGLAGRAHPDTSKEAAKTALTGKSRVAVLEVLIDAGPSGETQEWVSKILGISGDTVRPRIVELRKMGFVEVTDRKRLTEAGKQARVYRVTSAGTSAYATWRASSRND